MSADPRGKPMRRIAPLEERMNMQRDINTSKRDEAGESPEFSREMKKSISQELQSGGKSRNSRQITKMERVLAGSQPEPLSEAEKADLERDETNLIEQVQKMMIPRKMTRLKQFEDGSLNPDFRKAANEMAKTEFSQAYLEKAHRLKNIRRQLRPDDPDAGNLEYIRPD